MPSEREPVRLQLAFLTGQSDPGGWSLSPLQARFGQALLAAGRRLHPTNFPYREPCPPHRPVPLLAASWHNTRMVLASRRSDFGPRHRDGVLRLLEAAPHTVVLAGSCGLELLANLRLPAQALARVSVFAYGPVARGAPEVARLQVVCGRSDWISRLGWRGPALRVPGGHLGYLSHPEVLAYARGFVAAVEASLP